MNIKDYCLKITDVVINIRTLFDIETKCESINFICDKNEKKDVIIDFIEIDKAENMSGDLIYHGNKNIYQQKNRIIYEILPFPTMNPYAWLVPINRNKYKMEYLSGNESYFKYSKSILNIIPIDSILNKFGTILLHCSFIEYKGKGILFSAPSGTGKSTQANLWNKYEKTEIINGDRAGIRKIKSNWRAYGLPYAGSSNIFKNKSCLLSYIIILRQGKENRIYKLTPRDAFIKIYSETTIHTWDKEYQENTINQIMQLVQEVPIYQYECLPDKSAVDFLKEQIIKDRGLVLENNEF